MYFKNSSSDVESRFRKHRAGISSHSARRCREGDFECFMKNLWFSLGSRLRISVGDFSWFSGGRVQEECVWVSGSGLDRVQTEDCPLCSFTEGLCRGHSSLTIIMFLDSI